MSIDNHPWAPLSKEELDRIIKTLGVTSLDDLFKDIPEEIRLRRKLNIGYGDYLSEWEVQRLFSHKLEKNTAFLNPPPFMGGGVCYHTIPALVKFVLNRVEFLTAYTPYQAEINQGLLQALFEYQSLMADLLEMDIVNASMYDMNTAAAEAILMALRVTRKNRILVTNNIHPERLEVIRTWLLGKSVEIIEVGQDPRTGQIDLEDFDSKSAGGEIAAMYLEQPSFYGVLEENIEYVSDKLHKNNGLLIIGFEPLSLGIIKPPGSYGADIAVGEGQPLGLGLNYGGSTLGIFAIRAERKLLRQLPGRLIGLTRTVDGERAFAMILQTREQHIRRERATSNITTNAALMAIAAATYISLLGREGIREIAEIIWLKSHYAAKRLNELRGVKAPYYEAEFFKEFTTSFEKDYNQVYHELRKRGILGGLPLSRFYPDMRDKALFCVTEAHSRKDIDRLVDVLGEILG